MWEQRIMLVHCRGVSLMAPVIIIVHKVEKRAGNEMSLPLSSVPEKKRMAVIEMPLPLFRGNSSNYSKWNEEMHTTTLLPETMPHTTSKSIGSLLLHHNPWTIVKIDDEEKVQENHLTRMVVVASAVATAVAAAMTTLWKVAV